MAGSGGGGAAAAGEHRPLRRDGGAGGDGVAVYGDGGDRRTSHDIGSAQSVLPEESPSLTMWLCAIPACAGPFLFGYCQGFTSPAFNVNNDHVKAANMDTMMAMTHDQITWFGAVLSPAAAVGALVCGFPVERYGKRKGMMAANLLMAAGYAVLVATPAVVPVDADVPHNVVLHENNTAAMVQICTGRALMGLANGFVCVTSAAYMTEIATVKLRGVLGAFFQNAVVTGILFTYALGMFMRWQGLSYFAMGIGISGLVGTLFVPETPQWLVSKGRIDDAEAALRRLRANGTDIQGLMASLRLQTANTARDDDDDDVGDDGERSVWRELLVRPRGKALAIGFALMATCQLSGIAAVAAYAGKILGQVFRDPDQANSFAFYGQLIKFVVTSFASSLMKWFPRRQMLFGSLLGIVLSIGMMNLYFFDSSMPKALVMIGYVAYLISFSMGTGAITWLMLGEIFHPNVRATASSLCTAFNWMLTFYTVKTVSTYKEAFGGGDDASDDANNRAMGWVFTMYAGTSVLALFFVAFVLPETSGRSYKRVERALLGQRDAEDDVSAYRAKRVPGV